MRGSTTVPNLCLSVFGGIQPDKLTVYLEQSSNTLANDGMLQRFQVLVYPDPEKWKWTDKAPNREAREKVLDIFIQLSQFNPVEWGANETDFDTFSYFSYSADAQQISIAWSQDLHQNRLPAEDNPLIQQHLAKYDKLFHSLALVFHLVDCAVNGKSELIKRESVLRAAAWCEYLETHARRCYALVADKGFRSAQALADKLKRGLLSDGFTARDVIRHQWRYLTKNESIVKALEWLESDGWVKPFKQNDIGRPTTKYKINPAVKNG